MRSTTSRPFALVGLLSVAAFAACQPPREEEPRAEAPSDPAAPTSDADAGRAPPPEREAPPPDVDEPVVNLSELHYAQRALVGGHSHGLEREPTEPPGTVRVLPSPNPVPSWISEEGRAATTPVIAVAGDAPKKDIGPLYPPGLCTTPQPYVGSMTRSFPSGRTLKSPRSTFSSESSAVEYLKKVKAKMPFYLPYRHPKVRLSSGWLYGSGNSHRGQDYSRSDVPDGEDSTFAVRASAGGVVTDVFWTDLSGNIVVVEHTAPSGEKYVTYYSHLRNGRDADQARANAIDCTSVTDDRCEPYKKFATDYTSHVSWGTNDHVIDLKVGDTVSAGQFLAWAGNTGYGGAGWGLDDDGKPTSSRGNVHLHAYFGAAHPTDANVFVAVDPYGVYDEVDSKGCYDLLKDTAFDRLFAIVERYAGYYTHMGYSPRALDVHRSSDDVRVSGAFARGIPGAFAAVGYQKLSDYQATFDVQFAKGLVPRRTSVTYTAEGEPRFSGLFRPLEPGESIERRSSLDQAGWDERWQARVIDQEWRVDDFNAYRSGGSARYSALFTSHAGRPFVFYSRRPLSELKTLVADREAQGYVPVKVDANDSGGGVEYGAMLRKLPGCWRAHYGLTAEQHQAITSLRVAHGYRLEHVQAHGDPAQYTSVFARHGVDAAACGW